MEKKFSIHEVAELLGISTDAIRLYEKSGLVTPLRNEKNGYRYYEEEQIQRIIGISLYRKLNVGIAEIKRLLEVSDFETMESAFEGYIESREEEIKVLQNQLGKLKIMKEHMARIQQGVGVYCVKQLAKRYTKWINTTGIWEYEKMKKILSTELFSFGNICYQARLDNEGNCTIEELQFVIRDPMSTLCMKQIRKEHMEFNPECNCIYTVCTAKTEEESQWDFQKLSAYAQEQGYQCTGELYAFYVYSLVKDEKTVNFYEIYAPIL